MANQATLRTNGPRVGRLGAVLDEPDNTTDAGQEAGPAQVVTSVAEFGENLLTLGELQARLVAIELKQNVDTTKLDGSVVLVGAALALASLPVILVGVAELLVSELALKRGIAFLIVSGVALLIAGVGITIAGGRLRRSAVGFPVSREELARNLNWVRTVMLHSGRPARGR